jgi:ATP-dependent Clp protease ATP-binding subunit ClpX
MIPEFLGRLPVVVALQELDESALLNVLAEPKNAIIKQFRKLFAFENVDLKFTDGAMRAVVKEAIERKTGARGLRAILETSMLDMMYELPGTVGLKEVIITEEAILRKGEPILVYKTEAEGMKAEAGGKK